MALVALAAGCGGDDEPGEPPRTVATTERTAPATTERADAEAGAAGAGAVPGGRGANCASATGRVVYVEAVDPDGDGDAHFVLAGGNVTGPGLSVIDVRRDLRPDPLPRAGDTGHRVRPGVPRLLRPASDRGTRGAGAAAALARRLVGIDVQAHLRVP